MNARVTAFPVALDAPALFPAIGVAVECHADEAPDRVAIVDDRGGLLTYGELRRAVRGAADWFSSVGVVARDRVVLALPNSIDYAAAYLGLGALGAVAVAMSSRESGADIHRAALATNAVMVIAPGGERGSRLRHGLSAGSPASYACVSVGAAPDFQQWPGFEALAASDSTRVPVHRPPGDLDFIVFSSGTTGTPKGIAHTVGGAAFSVWNWVRTLGLSWRDGVFAPATFGHVGGLQWGMRTAFAAGARLAAQDRWDPQLAVDLIERHSLTYTLVTPTYIADLAALGPDERGKTQGFRYWTVGGSRMSPEFVQRAESRLGGEILRGFGMSETFMLTITRPDDPESARLDHDGRALPGCELEIRDERGVAVAPDVPGELYVRSPSLVDGYFTDAEQTAAAFEHGWFRTGDIATISAEGYLTITDRKKEIVIRGGENISPQEIEQVLAGFADLPPFAVTGVADDRLGECVAFVHEGDSAIPVSDLRAMLESTSLAKYKWPEVSILVAELPRTALGKVQRGMLRSVAANAVARARDESDSGTGDSIPRRSSPSETGGRRG